MPESHATVSTFFPFPNFFASCKAAATFRPVEVPANILIETFYWKILLRLFVYERQDKALFLQMQYK